MILEHGKQEPLRQHSASVDEAGCQQGNRNRCVLSGIGPRSAIHLVYCSHLQQRASVRGAVKRQSSPTTQTCKSLDNKAFVQQNNAKFPKISPSPSTHSISRFHPQIKPSADV